EVSALLAALAPDHDADAVAYAIRSYLPLFQVAPGGVWGTGGSIGYTTADTWFGQPLAPEDLRSLLLRYLAAFGPASVMDFQAWSGRVKLKDAVEQARPELRTFRDEQGKELFDLPDAPLPAADTPAPVRFVPEYDNLVLAHADRTRIIANEHRSKVFLSAGRVRSTMLVDGFVAGTWKTERKKQAATLIIEPFGPLPADVQAALSDEGEQLIRFIEDDASVYTVQFGDEM
ncbi:MAG: winged helix DNA-binding domain-containing protein, partial [Chloroflexaceae bacterium]|nr:winged helix DNA-binding domain-containing protein [Chloroflexaceae bacterium]